MFIRPQSLALLVSASAFLALTATAQQDRIGTRIDNSPTVVLSGHVPGRARAAVDQGPVDASFPLPLITMYLAPSSGQQTSLQQLLAAQQNPGSANYHKWLSPEQYADQFGVSQSDINRITAWLQSQGLQVGRVARSRTWIRFSGSAGQVGAAFHTQIHQYLEDGKIHYANASDPSIPQVLSGIVRGFLGLHNFRLRPYFARRPNPAYTAGGQHQIVPDDFATIYDVARLYSENINGTGQKLVIVGQTDIDLSDIETFRSKYGLPANNPQQILVSGSTDPGISQDDLPEADLDLEWSGAVARNATIIYVKSDDVNVSLTDAIDEARAPVISMSYGLCEGSYLSILPMYQSMALQANSEGITWLNAAGDTGAGDCEDEDAVIAQDGLAVDAPGSVPEVTSMGGSEFNEDGGNYWNLSNSATGRLPPFPIFQNESGTTPTSATGCKAAPAAVEPASSFQSQCGKRAQVFRATAFAMFPTCPSLPHPITTATLFTRVPRWRLSVERPSAGRPWPELSRCSTNIWCLRARKPSPVLPTSIPSCTGWLRTRAGISTI